MAMKAQKGHMSNCLDIHQTSHSKGAEVRVAALFVTAVRTKAYYTIKRRTGL
jgi:hypothetical protein